MFVVEYNGPMMLKMVSSDKGIAKPTQQYHRVVITYINWYILPPGFQRYIGYVTIQI